MKATAKCALALAAAALCVWLFRALAFTLCVVEGSGLEPTLRQGDRVLVNRWSYGLRTGSLDGLFGYGRLLARPIEKGDIVAIDSPMPSRPGLFLCRCKGLPGDTVVYKGKHIVVPGKRVTLAPEDSYWLETLGRSDTLDSRTFGPVGESAIIGRAVVVVYSHDDSQPFYKGYERGRAIR